MTSNSACIQIIQIRRCNTIPYHFDFGNSDVQSGYTAVTSSTLYAEMGYGFTASELQSGMERAPSNIPADYENVYNDQLLGETEFKADIPNGKYIVTIHYGTWNTGFGTNYTIEGVSSGNLYSVDSAQYTTEVEVTDGILDVSIAKGDRSYGGYISGMDVTLAEQSVEPTPVPPIDNPTPLPDGMQYTSSIEIEDTEVSFYIIGDDDAPEAQAILVQYNERGTLIGVKLLTVMGKDEITDVLNADTKTIKGFVWDMEQKPLAHLSYKEIE